MSPGSVAALYRLMHCLLTALHCCPNIAQFRDSSCDRRFAHQTLGHDRSNVYIPGPQRLPPCGHRLLCLSSPAAPVLPDRAIASSSSLRGAGTRCSRAPGMSMQVPPGRWRAAQSYRLHSPPPRARLHTRGPLASINARGGVPHSRLDAASPPPRRLSPRSALHTSSLEGGFQRRDQHATLDDVAGSCAQGGDVADPACSSSGWRSTTPRRVNPHGRFRRPRRHDLFASLRRRFLSQKRGPRVPIIAHSGGFHQVLLRASPDVLVEMPMVTAPPTHPPPPDPPPRSQRGNAVVLCKPEQLPAFDYGFAAGTEQNRHVALDGWTGG